MPKHFPPTLLTVLAGLHVQSPVFQNWVTITSPGTVLKAQRKIGKNYTLKISKRLVPIMSKYN